MGKANSIDPVQMLIRIYTVCYSSSSLFDPSTGKKMTSFNFRICMVMIQSVPIFRVKTDVDACKHLYPIVD